VKLEPLDTEALLEIGLALAGALLVVGVGTLAFGRTKGAAHHGRRRAEGPPTPGHVPPSRHQNIVANPPR